ncbi:hypothetical protein IE53DRAFT_74330 [Violaceomyces palustris]|uniref:Uncharacterized protein n=1 Tax=Violaceomyces palustris TaxID=1673888 RepID=A0ACD0NYM8_9BASI|nr:hypothetical protein IE53DRAFT_74330 [Violaceomyces palustris]
MFQTQTRQYDMAANRYNVENIPPHPSAITQQAARGAPLAPSDLYTNDKRRQEVAMPAPLAKPASPKKTKASGSSKKPQLPSPPRVIVDQNGKEYVRGQLLGQGGFARVYEVTDSDGRSKAFKVIAKRAIVSSPKNRQKLLAEIMIHKSLDHVHVVKFEDTFEDAENVYFKLELCRNGSMNDIVKRRGKYTEPEARYFMTQILAGCQNMHQNYIIHRDLKLGNIFLDDRMNVKIGDFGLAALLKYPEERKKTVCGTPNYIAPEVLYDQKEGHSFEVDVWSVGVILYTLLVGKPPFQTSDVQKIYDKIRKNDYVIPAEANVSPEAQDLIRQILTRKPSARPTLVEIMNHPWFQSGTIPLYIPSSAVNAEPFIPQLSRAESLKNFETLKRQGGWDEEADREPDEGPEDEQQEKKSTRDELRDQEQIEESRERMDREFQKALQPGSPISALLKAGRQPLVKAPQAASLGRVSGSSLARQLGSLTLSRAQGESAASRPEREGVNAPMAPPSAFSGRTNEPVRNSVYRGAISGEDANEDRRSLQQKARIVAGMNTATGSAVSTNSLESNGNTRRTQGSSSPDEAALSRPSSVAPPARRSQSSVEAMIQNLGDALQALDQGLLYEPMDDEGKPLQLPLREVDSDLGGTRLKPDGPKVFIISWLDHSERYGLGYALSDGTVGVHFRDSTSMILSASKASMDYISTVRHRSGSSSSLNGMSSTRMDQLRRENFPLPGSNSPNEESCQVNNGGLGGESTSTTTTTTTATATPIWSGLPKELVPKVKVMKYFENEIMERLYGADSPLTWVDDRTTTGMTFVHKWYRCHQAIVFRLSNSTIQFNFYDHTKLFLTNHGQIISVIEQVEKTDNVQVLKSWTLEEFISIANPNRSARESESEERAKRQGLDQPDVARTKPLERRLCRSLVKKVRYAREVLITTTSGGRSSRPAPPPPSSASTGPSATGGANANPPTLRSASIASLAPQGIVVGNGNVISRANSATSISSSNSNATFASNGRAVRA